MKRRIVLALAGLALLGFPPAQAEPPLYEPRVVDQVGKVLPAGACTAESVFELTVGADQNTPSYPTCSRLKVVFGPIWTKPGQNDVLIQPVTFEKPLYSGYLTRFKPDLVNVTGESPRVKDVHLHHGTWLNAGRSYGSGPWIASGEEKTIASWPKGYGLRIEASDTWLFLHMIHNATAETFPVWVTYTLDFVPRADGDVVQPNGKPLITNTKGIWLDVGDCGGWVNAQGASVSGCRKDTLNPVFNIQRGYGDGGVCIYPRQNCAQQNTLAGVSTQQGDDKGTVFDQYTIQENGTLVVMGGHLHFGGVRDDVYLVRNRNANNADCSPNGPADWEARLIHVSDAFYWDQNFNPNTWTEADNWDLSKNVVGGVPSSWDMVMTGVSKDIGWSVNVQRCDRLRLEGVYDAEMASWYEQMGIVMTWIAPGESTGLDVFAKDLVTGEYLVNLDTHPNKIATNPPTTAGYTLPGDTTLAERCSPSATTLCVRGQATHARIPTSGDHWSCRPVCTDWALRAANGPLVNEIHMGGFTYGLADKAFIDSPLAMVPTVKLDQKVRFWNADTADYMWHTVTRCALPCSGVTSASYPIPNGQWDDLLSAEMQAKDPAMFPDRVAAQEALMALNGADPMDFDSGQIGVGTGANQKLWWDWTPARTGTFTFFCRIHPSMRGAVRVVP